MRTIQIIASTRVDHGGTSRSIPAICDGLQDAGVDNYLVTAKPAVANVRCNFPRDGSRILLARESRFTGRISVGRQFRDKLRQLALLREDRIIVHDHAIWLMSNHAVASFCRRHNILRVVSPRGMLGSWAMQYGKIKKRIAWWLFQQADLASATAFHATSDQEALEIRKLGFTQPIAVIPNGVDAPACLPARQVSGRRQALFLSRIHPKKGLINLVRAWKRANLDNGWQLTLAGPDGGRYQQEVALEIAKLGLQDQIRFVGNVDGAEKWQLYVDSDLFVLPSFNENFGIVIAEAMAAGLPVITTTGTPWRVLQDQKMGWWVEPSVEAIAIALMDATSRPPDKLDAMGIASAAYVRRSFAWTSVAKQMIEFYRWLLADSEPVPNFVQLA